MRTGFRLTLLAGAMLFGGAERVRRADARGRAGRGLPHQSRSRGAARGAAGDRRARAAGARRLAADARRSIPSVAHNDFDSSEGDGDFTSLSTSLTLDQELYSGGETVANTERAERLVRLERARLQAIEQDVLLDAVTVYTNLLAAQAVLDFAIQNESRLHAPAAGDPGSLRGRRGHAHRRRPVRRPAVRARPPTGCRPRATSPPRAGRLSPGDQSGARQPGRAAAARRAAGQRARGAAAGRGRQPEHRRRAVRSRRGARPMSTWRARRSTRGFRLGEN